MRVLPPEQISRPAAYANRAERRARVFDVIEIGAAPAAHTGVPTSRAIVPADDGPFSPVAQLMFSQSRMTAPWLAHALGQAMAGEGGAMKPAVAVAAYERADSAADGVMRLQFPGACVVA